MPVALKDLEEAPSSNEPLTELPFPPITRSHILHCSYHYWHPKYRAVTPKARLIPLSPAFVAYLRADGIIVPEEDEVDGQSKRDDSENVLTWTNDPNGTEDDAEENERDISEDWKDIHTSIKSTIEELGGKVVPKLNWSAPKDATWINATNSMECRTPNDVYLLLKSSDFVTHDLEHAFDGCVTDNITASSLNASDIPYHLVLRKCIMFNPAVEFRCFVRRRKLLGMCQRDLNHFEFLFKMEDKISARIRTFFEDKLRDTFPDDSFVFDVYLPPPHERVWLIDINPWAPRTDPLLFSWLELLTMREPPEPSPDAALREDWVRLSLRSGEDAERLEGHYERLGLEDIVSSTPGNADVENRLDSVDDDAEDDFEDVFQPELRLIRNDDPEAYSFNTPQYSAHKLPRDVVDASMAGPGPLREFAEQWKEVLERRQREDDLAKSDEEEG